MALRKKRIEDVSKQFAGFFIGQVYKVMRKSVPVSEFGQGGKTERQFQEMVDAELANLSGKSSSYGLGEVIFRGLMRRDSSQDNSKSKTNAALKVYDDAVKNFKKESVALATPKLSI